MKPYHEGHIEKIFKDVREDNAMGYPKLSLKMHNNAEPIEFIDMGRCVPPDNSTPFAPWTMVTTGRVMPLQVLRGFHYMADEDGLHGVNKDGDKTDISNATVKVVRIETIYLSEDEKKENIILNIYSKAWQGAKELSIPFEKYKDAFQIIHKRFPSIYLADGKLETERYLSDVFKNDIDKAEHVVRFLYSGWALFNGTLQYRIGIDVYYETTIRPSIKRTERGKVFNEGISFLCIGNSGPQVWLPLLFALAGPLIYWLKLGDVALNSVLYLKGETGSLKTSTVSELCNVFDRNRANATIRMTSTMASIQESIIKLRDNCICLDDFSNSSLVSAKKALENAENVIRAVGDGHFPDKMSIKSIATPRRDVVRCSLILTGEDDLVLGRSSLLRIITVPVDRSSFDGEKLSRFQNNRTLMRNFFSSFIDFMEEHGVMISKICNEEVQRYRKEYSSKIAEPRYVSTASVLRFVLDVLNSFAKWSGSEFPESQMESGLQSIINVMIESMHASNEVRPEVRFLYAIANLIDSDDGAKVAQNEVAYAERENRFIGFYENEGDARLLWLKFEDAFAIVREFYIRRGETWLVRKKALKEHLVSSGAAVGRIEPHGNGKSQFLQRAKKGSRKRMLVIRVKNMKEVIEEVL